MEDRSSLSNTIKSSCLPILALVTISVTVISSSNMLFSQEPKLQVLPPLTPDTTILIKDRIFVKTINLVNREDSDIKIETIKFEPSSPNAPKENQEIKITGLNGVTLGKGASTEISIFFPKHTQIEEYEGWLYYVTSDKSDKSIPFYKIRLKITNPARRLMSGQIWAIVVSAFFSLLILILTLTMDRLFDSRLGFIQSPDGSYSASKFQIWLWTLVIIFSFVYVFLHGEGPIDFPQSIWLLLGISVGSTGTAKFLSVSRLGQSVSSSVPTEQPKDKPKRIRAKLASMLSENGQLSLMRLQMFGWTIVTAGLFIVHVLRTVELWDVPTGLLVLMGISHTGYLGDKVASPAEKGLEFDRLEPKTIKKTESKDKSLIILGQNFKPKIVVYLNSIELSIEEKTVLSNRITAKIPKELEAGKYDLSLQNPGEKAKSLPEALEITI